MRTTSCVSCQKPTPVLVAKAFQGRCMECYQAFLDAESAKGDPAQTPDLAPETVWPPPELVVRAEKMQRRALRRRAAAPPPPEPVLEPPPGALEVVGSRREVDHQSEPAGPLPLNAEDGLSYFCRQMYAGHPEWGLVAVEGDAEETAAAYARLFGCERWERDTRDRPLTASANVGSEIYLVRFVGQRWNLLLRLPRTRFSELKSEAKLLAKALRTRTVVFAYEETGGSSLAQRIGGPGSRSHSVKRQDWPEFFRDLDLFVPVHYLAQEPPRSWLVLEGVEVASVERLDFFAGRKPIQ